MGTEEDPGTLVALTPPPGLGGDDWGWELEWGTPSPHRGWSPWEPLLLGSPIPGGAWAGGCVHVWGCVLGGCAFRTECVRGAWWCVRIRVLSGCTHGLCPEGVRAWGSVTGGCICRAVSGIGCRCGAVS